MAEQCARKPDENSGRGSGPIGDDVEPIEAPPEDVKMRSALVAEVPFARMNPKNPTSREKQEHEDSCNAVCRNRCAACV